MKAASQAQAVSLETFVSDLVALAKPRITFVVICTTLAGMWIAPGTPPLGYVVMTLLGVSLVVGGANALNMYLERDIDGLMERTKNRPLPAGRLRPEIALAFGLAICAVGVLLLALRVNLLTAGLSLFAFIVYVWGYTPLKRRSTAALLVGAVPGALPPLLGWTAATGSIDAPGQALFLVLFVWQLPHFIAISLFRQEDYTRAGIKIVPEKYGIAGANQRVLLYSLLLMAVSLHVARIGLGGALYVTAAVVLGLIAVAMAVAGMRRPTRGWARAVFFYSLIYLPALFAALMFDVA